MMMAGISEVGNPAVAGGHKTHVYTHKDAAVCWTVTESHKLRFWIYPGHLSFIYCMVNMMFVWRIRQMIMRTFLCCTVYCGCTQWYTHRIRQTIMRTFLCCTVYCGCTQWYTHRIRQTIMRTFLCCTVYCRCTQMNYSVFTKKFTFVVSFIIVIVIVIIVVIIIFI